MKPKLMETQDNFQYRCYLFSILIFVKSNLYHSEVNKNSDLSKAKSDL